MDKKKIIKVAGVTLLGLSAVWPWLEPIARAVSLFGGTP